MGGTVTKVKWHPSRILLGVALQSGTEGTFLVDPRSGPKTYLDSISPEGARGLTWSPDGEYLAVGDNEGYLLIYSSEGRLLRRRKVQPKAIIDLSWHPDRQLLATVGSGIGLYDFAADSTHYYASRDIPVLLLSVAWHPEGEVFVTGDYGDEDLGNPPLLQFWTVNGKLLHQDSSSRAEYRNLRWSPDGQVLASASDGIRYWSEEGRELMHTLDNRYVWGLAWNETGDLITATTGDGRTYVFTRSLEFVRSW